MVFKNNFKRKQFGYVMHSYMDDGSDECGGKDLPLWHGITSDMLTIKDHCQ